MAIPGNLLSSTTESIDPNTSGWTSKLNCTIAKGTGGRNGDGCLVVKSVAAGEIQARTVSSYPVVAGTVYQAFSDTAGVVAERIGIRWLTATGTEVSVTWSLTTAAASSGWHRVSVAGAAPATATQAQVLLSSTEVGSTVNHYWENVYLGLPIRTVGNLLNFNTESAEIDAAGWASITNAAISRQVPVVSWAVDAYNVGGHTLAITAVANGNASALAIDRPTVTPGTEYLAYAYLQPPTSGSTTWIELRFYDGSGTQIAAQKSTLAAPGTGMYRQRASLAAPSNAATCSVAAGVDSATAGQVLRLETVVVTAATKLQAGSVMPYADTGFEQGVAGWTTASGIAVLSRTTPWGNAYFEGSYALNVASSTATASTLRSAKFATPGAAGQNFRAQILAHVGAGSWTNITIKVRWYNASNTDLGASTGTLYAIPGGSWYALASDAVAPATATQAAIELIPTASATSSVLHIDQVVLWQVLPLTSVQAVDDSGYIQLTLRELPLDWLLTVYRITPDGARALVRGTSGLVNQQAITSDILVIEDHEAPIGVSVYYRIEMRSSPSAGPSSRTSAPAVLSLADINETWLKDPGNPQRNMRVVVQGPPDWEQPIQQSVQRVRGRRRAVVLSGIRGGLEGSLAVWTRTDEERIALRTLLSSGNTLLWQANPGMGVDDMYVSVAGVSEGRIGGPAQEPWRTWTLPLTEQDMPVTTAVNGAAGRTWQDVVTEFDTCADLLAVYATCEDLLLDRRMG
ncbi:hypothetical protein B0675_39735 [Streptomyces sp. M41(2017)]|uniref:hypothetical protein n=1 Tax=Streptomyces sp. M41(2017) TaxID=1955065 RepID=UPI0009BCC670|nr:hypothetical protein [Streptomyces sp. M41(2017)]OQQ12956.1 hypothetical protein B0675_39735 [Streptomyces sp. M41(2017)]